MSDMFITEHTNEIKTLEDAAYRSGPDRFINPTGKGVVVHYHQADITCIGRKHRFFVDGEEVETNGQGSHIELR